tara:strand:+ start:70 stop:327 length:258 start_codon:yes stop_codon:yes gene_type:complete
MTLTGQEIKELAELAGFTINPDHIEPDYLEAEYYITSCPKQGVMDDDGSVATYSHVVICDGMDESECQPLGDKISTLGPLQGANQ